jgi:hypothetical protein
MYNFTMLRTDLHCPELEYLSIYSKDSNGRNNLHL